MSRTMSPEMDRWLADQQRRKWEEEAAVIRFIGCDCKQRDRWGCAVAQGLRTVTCHCACHRVPVMGSNG